MHERKLIKLKKGYIPYYKQIQDILKERIIAGKISPSERFPTERDLCKEFGVSSITVRQALKNLELDNLIVREQGRGTFLRRSGNNISPFELFGSDGETFILDEQTTLQLNTKEVSTADKVIAKEIGVEIGEKIGLFHGTRTFLLEPQYRCRLIAYLPKEIAERIPLETDKFQHFKDIIENLNIETVASIHYDFWATTASEADADIMGIKPKSPVLVIKSRYHNRSGKVICTAFNILPPRSRWISFTFHYFKNEEK